MSSVSSRFAQRLTRTLKVGSNTGFFYRQSAIDSWYADNKSVITKLGTNYVLSEADFATNVAKLDFSYLLANMSLKDLGREIKIGTTTEAGLIVLRLMQLPGPVASNGTPNYYDTIDTGYVVVANNSELEDSTVPKGLKVYVSRV